MILTQLCANARKSSRGCSVTQRVRKTQVPNARTYATTHAISKPLAQTHIHKHIHKHKHKRVRAHTHIHKHIYICTLTHISTHMYSHTYKHTHARTRMHTQTYSRPNSPFARTVLRGVLWAAFTLGKSRGPRKRSYLELHTTYKYIHDGVLPCCNIQYSQVLSHMYQKYVPTFSDNVLI